MLELEQDGYYPLTRDHLDQFVPTEAGIFMLAIRLVSGAHKAYYTNQSDDLHDTLGAIADGDWHHLPPMVCECLEKFRCYFAFFILPKSDNKEEVMKMLSQSADPFMRLKIVNCN